MKAKITISKKGRVPDPRLKLQRPRFVLHRLPPALPEEGNLLDRPLSINDPPENQPDITQREIVAVSTAGLVLWLARSDFEAKRAALTLKLLRYNTCEESDYFASLDDQGNLVIEDRTSLDPITNRLLITRQVFPSGGAA
jgi:hypothetical protein